MPEQGPERKLQPEYCRWKCCKCETEISFRYPRPDDQHRICEGRNCNHKRCDNCESIQPQPITHGPGDGSQNKVTSTLDRDPTASIKNRDEVEEFRLKMEELDRQAKLRAKQPEASGHSGDASSSNELEKYQQELQKLGSRADPLGNAGSSQQSEDKETFGLRDRIAKRAHDAENAYGDIEKISSKRRQS